MYDSSIVPVFLFRNTQFLQYQHITKKEFKARKDFKVSIIRLKKSDFLILQDSQRKEFFETFPSYIPTENFIDIEYSSHNYTCAPFYEKMVDSKIQALSFFSGCGGLDIGAQMAGAKVLSSLDFDKDAVTSLKANKFFSHTLHQCKDIREAKAQDYSNILKINNPEKLVLVGGPPCQPFSKAGYWKTLSQRLGPKDPRNMIGSYLNLISDIQPDGFILENVESILHPHNIQAVEDLKEVLVQLNYHYTIQRINAIDYGVPQKRKRVFVIASKKPITTLPTPTHGDGNNLLPVERVIDWIGIFDNKKYACDGDNAEGLHYDSLLHVPPGSNYISLSSNRGFINPRFKAGSRYWTFLLKLHPLLPSWTIIAQPGHWEGPFHWTNRRLRLQELAAIQTFPYDYKIVGSPRNIHKQIGNAVPCILGKKMVECLINNL